MHANYIKAGPFTLRVGKKTYIMGVLNVTPDSFSDGGMFLNHAHAVAHADKMIEAHADIIDIGGESTRPGHTPVDAETQIQRTCPVIARLKSRVNVPLSIDTSDSKVALAAVEAGASIINDVWGLKKDPDIARVAATTESALVLMFNATNTDIVSKSDNIVEDAMRYLHSSIETAIKQGVSEAQLIVDPGIGFGVNMQESLTLIHNIPRIKELGFPLLLGPSKKRFIGAVLDAPVEDRQTGTLSVCAIGAYLGADILRVHEVYETSRVIKMARAIKMA